MRNNKYRILCAINAHSSAVIPDITGTSAILPDFNRVQGSVGRNTSCPISTSMDGTKAFVCPDNTFYNYKYQTFHVRIIISSRSFFFYFHKYGKFDCPIRKIRRKKFNVPLSWIPYLFLHYFATCCNDIFNVEFAQFSDQFLRICSFYPQSFTQHKRLFPWIVSYRPWIKYCPTLLYSSIEQT